MLHHKQLSIPHHIQTVFEEICTCFAASFMQKNQERRRRKHTPLDDPSWRFDPFHSGWISCTQVQIHRTVLIWFARWRLLIWQHIINNTEYNVPVLAHREPRVSLCNDTRVHLSTWRINSCLPSCAVSVPFTAAEYTAFSIRTPYIKIQWPYATSSCESWQCPLRRSNFRTPVLWKWPNNDVKTRRIKSPSYILQ
jgi:hypothetical protein